MPLYDLKQVDCQPQDPFGIWIEWTADDLATVHRWCPICKKPSEVKEVSQEGIEAWSLGTGEYVQYAFPTKTAAERDTILIGTHEMCYDDEFPEDEDEEPWFEDSL
jgi:hypothetical protein